MTTVIDGHPVCHELKLRQKFYFLHFLIDLIILVRAEVTDQTLSHLVFSNFTLGSRV